MQITTTTTHTPDATTTPSDIEAVIDAAGMAGGLECHVYMMGAPRPVRVEAAMLHNSDRLALLTDAGWKYVPAADVEKVTVTVTL